MGSLFGDKEKTFASEFEQYMSHQHNINKQRQSHYDKPRDKVTIQEPAYGEALKITTSQTQSHKQLFRGARGGQRGGYRGRGRGHKTE